jgi:PHD/YefM family antitoxin component YafN of YafNO toxin-antitoxin module
MHAISEANRIFGFDGWNRETVESRCVLARENRGTFLAVYIAKVKITVHADGTAIIREGHGRPELIVMSVEDYELLRQGRKTPYRIDNMPIEKIERIAANRMDDRHVHLNALMND